MGAVMGMSKSSSVSPTRKRLTQHHDGSGDSRLRLQLENELDKLAMLMQEVREQSARVQAAADAIGDRKLLDAARQSSSANPHRADKLASIATRLSL